MSDEVYRMLADSQRQLREKQLQLEEHQSYILEIEEGIRSLAEVVEDQRIRLKDQDIIVEALKKEKAQRELEFSVQVEQVTRALQSGIDDLTNELTSCLEENLILHRSLVTFQEQVNDQRSRILDLELKLSDHSVSSRAEEKRPNNVVESDEDDEEELSPQFVRKIQREHKTESRLPSFQLRPGNQSPSPQQTKQFSITSSAETNGCLSPSPQLPLMPPVPPVHSTTADTSAAPAQPQLQSPATAVTHPRPPQPPPQSVLTHLSHSARRVPSVTTSSGTPVAVASSSSSSDEWRKGGGRGSIGETESVFQPRAAQTAPFRWYIAEDSPADSKDSNKL